jgi:pilus assembly protein CpaE
MADVPSNDTGSPPAERGFGASSHERPVPRISIEVFSDSQDTVATMQRVAADRRVAKAHVNIQAGGIQAAAKFFSGNQTPNLLIVETREQGKEVLSELEQLANVCDERTKVIVVGRANDVFLYRELIKRGVSEYLVAPLSVLPMIETISGLYVNPKAPPIGRIIAFAGVRGGAGASTIAHNVAWYIAEAMKIDTVILDFDLPFGTLGLNFNEEPGSGIADALSAPERLDETLLDRLLIKNGEHLSLFAAPAMLDRDYEIDQSAFEAVIEQVRQSIPCVVVDLPYAWPAWKRKVLSSADEVVIVATPDLASLRNTKNMIDVLKTRRANDTPPKVVINQTGVPKRPEIPVKEFAAAIGCEPSLVLPFEPHIFGAAANNGQMLAEVQANSRAAEGVRLLAELVTGRAAAKSVKKNILSSLPFLAARKAG